MQFIAITSSNDMWKEVSHYLFVDEKYRGQRLSQKLISYAISYLQAQGFHQAYLVSDHENLYEKYGFKVIDKKMAPWGKIEKIYYKLF